MFPTLAGQREIETRPGVGAFRKTRHQRQLEEPAQAERPEEIDLRPLYRRADGIYRGKRSHGFLRASLTHRFASPGELCPPEIEGFESALADKAMAFFLIANFAASFFFK